MRHNKLNMDAAKKSNLINAALFQAIWFAAVYGGANAILWPSIILFIILCLWQLNINRRAGSDYILITAALCIGLTIDSIWINIGMIDYTDKRPLIWLSPIWILILWMGLALTINHSMAWLKLHPLLPILCGLISAPLSYYTGQRLGAMTYHQDPLLVSAYIGLAWAVALPLLVKISHRN